MPAIPFLRGNCCELRVLKEVSRQRAVSYLVLRVLKFLLGQVRESYSELCRLVLI